MEAGLIILFGSLVLVTALGYWAGFIFQNSERQLERLSAKMKKIENSREFSENARSKLLKGIYVLIAKELAKENSQILYKSLDLLNLAFGHGLGREKDPRQITKIISRAMKTNNPNVLSYAIHAFNPYIRKSPEECISPAIEELGIIAATALKQYKNFLASRAIELIFEGLERLSRAKMAQTANFEPPANISKVLELVGLAVLRCKDIDLLRELCVKQTAFVSELDKNQVFKAMWPGIFAAWLNQLGRVENATAFTLVLAHLKLHAENNNFDENGLKVLIEECRHTAGVSNLNPDSEFTLPMFSFMLTASYGFKDIQSWKQAVCCIREAVQIICSKQEIEKGFRSVYPLLEAGRRIMISRLRIGVDGVNALFEQEALELTVKECLQIARYESRKNFLLSVPDVVIKLKDCWLIYPETGGSPKYLAKFCHLLILYWARTNPKDACNINWQSLESFLTEEEKKKLEFLF